MCWKESNKPARIGVDVEIDGFMSHKRLSFKPFVMEEEDHVGWRMLAVQP